MEKDEYDINNYTDQECFDVLNLNNPSDRELEMKILEFMNKYEEKSKRLYHFFESMYDRFFTESDEDEDEVEGFANIITNVDKPKLSSVLTGGNADADAVIDALTEEEYNYMIENLDTIVNGIKPQKKTVLNFLYYLRSQQLQLQSIVDGDIATLISENQFKFLTENMAYIIKYLKSITPTKIPKNDFITFLKNSYGDKSERFKDIDIAEIDKSNENKKEKPQTKIVGNATTNISTVATHNVDYIADPKKLNPVERKTIFKMISIDSQFREDPGNTNATNFTMNLTESIENVISMKLYSVQIPYTWYTINETFGSNFFYIKGNSPGINNGDHDVQVAINSGTYTGDAIVSAINNQLTFLKNMRLNTQYRGEYPSVVDLSLGETKISYQLGATDAKIVFEIDLKKKYNETDYQLYFPYWTTPNVIGTEKSRSIPSFLGFNYTNYYPYIAYSQKNVLPLIEGDIVSANATLYTVNPGSSDPTDISNNYFTIYQYIGTDHFNIAASTVINKIQVKLTLANGTYSRNTIYNDVSEELSKNIFLDTNWSYFRRINNTSIDLSNSHFEIAVKLNRIEIPQTDNSKLAIVFPTETNITGKHIWTGNDSCFVFKNVDTIELNEIVSETETLLTNYIIDLSAATINIECTKPGYDVSENIRIATVPSSLSNGYPNGYLFANYIDAVNTALIEMNATTADPIYKPNGEFNIIVGSTYNTALSIVGDNANFQFDIAREFNQTTYIVDLSSCFLSKDPFFFDASYHNLTNSNFTSIRQFSSAPSITINSTNNKLVLIPKKNGGPYGNGYGNQNSPNIELFFTQTRYDVLDDLIRGINSDFIRFVDSDSYPIMTGSSITFLNSTLSLQFGISKVLTEINYNVSFIDNSIRNSWDIYLHMNPTYILANNMAVETTHAEVVGTSPVFNNIITVTPLNNTFIFKPYINGVADVGGANDIIFSVPLDSTNIKVYTREGLITAIQTLFDASVLANGSKITLINDGNLQYTNIRLNVNKTYYASDFKLVFYDSVSFVYCNVGVAQNATWDSTLGWLLGFHSFTEYALTIFTDVPSTDIYYKNRFNNNNFGYNYSYNSSAKKIAVRGDVPLNTNLYNYFLVVLDDFIQNHVNAGLITITSLENDVALPSYASRVSYQCDPVTGLKTAVSATNKLSTELTSKQLYAMNQIIENRRTKSKSYASGPYLKDVFALIPIKLTGMVFGQTYMEFGGTLQNQDRKYYGPVRIQKFSIKLMNDKGQIVDLNGANFSICLICEILNTNTK
jgi:hypothetical protein